jgi:hypothetical protein
MPMPLVSKRRENKKVFGVLTRRRRQNEKSEFREVEKSKSFELQSRKLMNR